MGALFFCFIEDTADYIGAFLFLGLIQMGIDIAKSEGSGASSVHEGIQRGLRRLKKILKKMESDPEKKA